MKTISFLLDTNTFEKIKKHRLAKKKYALDISSKNIFIAGQPIPRGKVLSSMNVSDRAASKILTAFNRQQTTLINLTPTQMKQLIENVDVRPTHGAGDISGAFDVVGELQGVVKDNAPASYDNSKRRIEARLKYLQGKGVKIDPDNLTDAQKAGVQLAQHIEKTGKVPDSNTLKQLAQPHVDGQKEGNGLSGLGWWSDFIDGFVYGFTNPLDAIQLLGEEIINAIKGGELTNDDQSEKKKQNRKRNDHNLGPENNYKTDIELLKRAEEDNIPLTVVSIDQLDNATNCSIINSDTAASGGKHWVAFYGLPDQCFFFDPFGLPPDTRIIEWAKHANANRKLHYNTLQRQDVNDTDCGRRCYAFIKDMHNSDMPMTTFKQICKVL